MGKKLYPEESVSDIAAAIREKNGLTTTYNVSEMGAAVRAIPTSSTSGDRIKHGDIPDYIKDAALALAKKVKEKQTSRTITFISMSDAHQSETAANVKTGNLHAGMAAKILAYALPNIDFCCYLGDYTEGNSTTTLAEGRKHFSEINADIDEAFEGIPQFRTLGNHDSLQYSKGQNGGVLSVSELYAFCGSYNEGAVYGSTTEGYCYRDFESKKLRVICLNTAESTEKELVSDVQKTWFANTLKAVGAKTGWSVIILSHHPLDWGNVCALSNIVHAYHAGGSIAIGSSSVNFSGSNKATILAAVHGHVHCFKAARLNKIEGNVGTEYDVWRVATPNMCFNRNNEYGSNTGPEYYGIEFGESTTYNKTSGGANDTAFVVNVVDPAQQKIYSFCYGAGYDREIFTGVQTIAVTGITLNASSGELTVGGEVTLTPTVLPTTASNKAVTWSSSKPAVASVNNGVVKALTEGTATITATTVDGGFTASYDLTVKKVQPTVVDLISTHGYADNIRLSTSAGNEKAENGYVTIGHTTPIPVDKTTYPNGATIRVTGAVNCAGDIWSGTENGAYSAWVLYTGTGTTFSQASYIKTGSADAVGTITVDEDKKGFTLVLASLAAPRYLKFCVRGSGAAITATLTPN